MSIPRSLIYFYCHGTISGSSYRHFPSSSRSPHLPPFPQDSRLVDCCNILACFWEDPRHGTTERVAFCFWFLSLNTVLLKLIMLLSALISCSFLLLSSSPLYGVATGHYLLTCWWTLGIFPAGGYYKQLLLRTFACSIGFPFLGKHLGMALLAHLVTVCFNFNSLKLFTSIPWSFSFNFLEVFHFNSFEKKKSKVTTMMKRKYPLR